MTCNKELSVGFSQKRIYRTYRHMRDRCYRESDKHYSHYGGRGIRVCDEWLGENGFANFYF